MTAKARLLTIYNLVNSSELEVVTLQVKITTYFYNL